MPVLSKAQCTANERSLAHFKAEITFFMQSFENAQANLELDAEIADKLNEILSQLNALTTFETPSKKHMLNANAFLVTLRHWHEMLVQNNLADAQGLTWAQKIKKREMLQGMLTGFEIHLDCVATYRVPRMEKLKSTLFAASFFVASISVAITLGALVSVTFPIASVVYLGVIALVIWAAIGKASYHSNLFKKSKPVQSPWKAGIKWLSEQLNENIIRQKAELAQRVVVEAFFDSKDGVETSPAFQQLSEKRANKIKALKANLDIAKSELVDIERANAATLQLLESCDFLEGNSKGQLEILALGETHEMVPHYIYHDHQQKIAAALCSNKIKALEAAIAQHEGEAVVPEKYNKYRECLKTNVNTDAARLDIRSHGILFLWQKNRAVKMTSSRKINTEVLASQSEIQVQPYQPPASRYK